MNRLLSIALSLPLTFLGRAAAAQTDSAEEAAAAVVMMDAPRLASWAHQNAPWALSDVLGRASWRWVAMFLTIGVFLLIRRPVLSFVLGGARKLSAATDTDLDDKIIGALDAPLRRFISILGVYIGLLWPQFSGRPQTMLDSGFRVVIIVLVGWAGLRSISIAIEVLTAISGRTENRLDDHLVPLVGRILRVTVVCLVALVAFQEVGINVAGLIAGLGVGGLALALAAKDTVANWFGALMIYTDRPFEIGDSIKVSGITGAVEDVGLRSTRIRTGDKTLVTIPNSTLASGAVENLSWRTKRKGTTTIALAVATPPDKIRAAVEAIGGVLRDTEGVEQDTFAVKLAELTATELSVLVQYFTESAGWDDFIGIREEVNLRILERLAELGVPLAVPTTALKVEREGAL